MFLTATAYSRRMHTNATPKDAMDITQIFAQLEIALQAFGTLLPLALQMEAATRMIWESVLERVSLTRDAKLINAGSITVIFAMYANILGFQRLYPLHKMVDVTKELQLNHLEKEKKGKIHYWYN